MWSAPIGISTGDFTTINVSITRFDGLGAATDGSVCISTDCEPCIGIIKAVGAASAPTGICGARTSSIDLQDGSGGGITALAGICIACAF